MKFALPVGLATSVLLLLVSVHAGFATAPVNPLCPVIEDEHSSCLAKVAYDIGDSMCDGDEGECVTCVAQAGMTCAIPGGAFTISNTTRVLN